MDKLFHEEIPLVTPYEDEPKKMKKLKKLARKVEKFADNHPFVTASIAIGTVNVVAYGLLAAVTNSEADSDSQDDFEIETTDSE